MKLNTLNPCKPAGAVFMRTFVVYTCVAEIKREPTLKTSVLRMGGNLRPLLQSLVKITSWGVCFSHGTAENKSENKQLKRKKVQTIEVPKMCGGLSKLHDRS